MKHNFHERRQNRKDYHENQAAKKEKESDQLWEEANKMASAIPMGQPIQVGHHSEKWDRRYRQKIHDKSRKSIQVSQQAKYHSDKAEAIDNNDAIFSDDPDALPKLQEKLKGLETLQEFMKFANSCIRKKDKTAFLAHPLGTEERWTKLHIPDCFKCIGFAPYKLTNNNANIQRLKKRIATQEAAAKLEAKEETINGVRLLQNTDANRVQLIFPDKPEGNIRAYLKKSGFRWSRSEMAWQRHLNASAVYVARDVLRTIPTL
jgi:hypothetical protein